MTESVPLGVGSLTEQPHCPWIDDRCGVTKIRRVWGPCKLGILLTDQREVSDIALFSAVVAVLWFCLFASFDIGLGWWAWEAGRSAYPAEAAGYAAFSERLFLLAADTTPIRPVILI